MQISFKPILVKKVASNSSLFLLKMPRGVPFIMITAEGTKDF
jgi:hypothetical protein